MANITIELTADEDDLRVEADAWGDCLPDLYDVPGTARRVRNARAIAAALPKPRIHPKASAVLLRKRDNKRFFANVSGVGIYLSSAESFPIEDCTVWEHDVALGLDANEWEVLLP